MFNLLFFTGTSSVGGHSLISSINSSTKASSVFGTSSLGCSNLLLILRQFGVASDALVFCGDGICDISKLISNAVDEELPF